MELGDKVFFYHRYRQSTFLFQYFSSKDLSTCSSCKVPAIVGIAKVVSKAVPDPTALNPEHKYFDPKSDPKNPKWFGVEIRLERRLQRPITLETLKTFRYARRLYADHGKCSYLRYMCIGMVHFRSWCCSQGRD
jgi:predicted RNA-binding protein with PUA-like domain